MQDFFFEVKGLTVGYDGVPLIRDITLGINKGEVLTLIGPNGAGKSTILKSIIGQLSLLAGVVLLDNHRLDEMSEKERAKSVSIVLTDKISTELLTAREGVEMG
ncbi:MAG: ABC transporter ATP-binding protein, partial [Butyrivibrio sp.]|nr:ABC transporter ATP-binding protein [Butyrivibrio sp.]